MRAVSFRAGSSRIRILPRSWRATRRGSRVKKARGRGWIPARALGGFERGMQGNMVNGLGMVCPVDPKPQHENELADSTPYAVERGLCPRDGRMRPSLHLRSASPLRDGRRRPSPHGPYIGFNSVLRAAVTLEGASSKVLPGSKATFSCTEPRLRMASCQPSSQAMWASPSTSVQVPCGEPIDFLAVPSEFKVMKK